MSIKPLIEAINSIAEGNFEPIKFSAEEEFAELIEVLNKMLGSLQKKMVENERQLDDKIFTLYALNYASKLIGSTLEMEELLDVAINMLLEIAEMEKGSIILVEKNTSELVVEVIKEFDKVKYHGKRIDSNKGFLADIIKKGEPFFSNNIKEFQDVGDGLGVNIRSILSIPLMGKEAIIGVVNLYNHLNNKELTQDDLNIIYTLSSQVAVSIENAQLFSQIKELFFNTVKALSATIDTKDSYTYGHSERVTQYSLAIAEELGFNSKEKEDVQLAALLHDIGKIGLPDVILNKPAGLTDEEFAEIKQHPLKGSKILEHIKGLTTVIPGMQHHPEKFGGGGYPDGLKGEEIPLLGKIIAVADAYDAMTSDHSYRKRLSYDEALKRIKDGAEIQFDPKIVNIFVNLFEKGRIVEQNNKVILQLWVETSP
ncbi:MAG: HD domain-containing phosphohydrolase [Nitrospirota bacterium]